MNKVKSFVFQNAAKIFERAYLNKFVLLCNFRKLCRTQKAWTWTIEYMNFGKRNIAP